MNRLSTFVCVTAAIATASLGAQDKVRPGKWTTKAHIADGWVVHNTRHYQIQSEAGEDKAERLADHMETMFRVYSKLFPPGKSGFSKKPIKLFKDRQSFLDYGAPPSAAGYYTYQEREMVCYDTGRWMDEDDGEGPLTGKGVSRKEIMERLLSKSKMDLLGVMAHEGWHQYFHWYVVSMVGLPSWINEGMGDYFYAARPIEVKGKHKLPAEVGRMNGERLPMIRVAVKQKRNVPLEAFLGYFQADYYANAGLCYAQGWALCQFLLHHENKKIREIIPKYIRLVRDDTNTDTVTKKAFKGVDFEELDKEFQEWVLGLKLSEEEQLEKALEEADEADLNAAIEAAKAALQPPVPPAGDGAGGGVTDPSGGGADTDPAAGDKPVEPEPDPAPPPNPDPDRR